MRASNSKTFGMFVKDPAVLTNTENRKITYG